MREANMDGHGSESDDDFQHVSERLRSGSSAAPETSNVRLESVTDGSETATLRSITRTSTAGTDRASIFSTNTTIPSRSDTPTSASVPLRPITSPLPSSRPLATLIASSSVTPRRAARFMEAEISILGDAELPQAEKDGDDPTTLYAESSRQSSEYQTPAALTRLLASHAAEPSSESDSHSPSYTLGNPNLVQRISSAGTASLPDHLYTRGLLGGKHSDIAVIAFAHKYNLHRLILDRAPFFATALSEPWMESTSKEIVLHPGKIDNNISQKSFELALKRLYGCDISDEQDVEAVGLFATGFWLEMQDLVDCAIESILRQMSSETLSPTIKIVTNNYYGRGGERILASAKAMLCRDGWEMALKLWDGIPGEIVREIVGGDGFYINGEWERWVLAKRLLDRRLKQKAIDCGLLEPGSRSKIRAPDTLSLNAVRFDTVYRKNSIVTGGQAPQNNHDRWISLYTHPDIEPILVLLDEGIHYIHLEFERLQYIRQARDIFGLPVLPERVISNALWQQMELRQKVVNARENDLELGISQPAEALHRIRPSADEPTSSSPEAGSKGKQKANEPSVAPTAKNIEDDNDELDSGSWDANAQPRKFWIPSTDCNIVMGGNAEPMITTSTTSTFMRLASRMSATLDPGDVLWATDFAASPATNTEGINRPTTPARPGSSSGSANNPAPAQKPLTYSNFPPFRFAAEFPNPKSLKEKKRVYSRTIFYAGSLWNIYIQKVRSSKNPQLGVYLHRAKERETDDANVIAGNAGAAAGGTVDERIGLLEREMIIRSEQGRSRPGRLGLRHSDTGGSRSTANNADADDGSMAAFRRRNYATDQNTSMLDTSYTAYDSDSDSSDSVTNLSAPFTNPDTSLTHFPSPSNNTSARNSAQAAQLLPPVLTPALPTYTDTRPTIKTYFKIYSPSKGGRLLSVYESAPDQFNFSQSWGWKSSTLMLDEGFTCERSSPAPPKDEPAVTVTAGDQAREGAEAATAAPAAVAAGAEPLAVEVERELEREREKRRKKDGSLRFMIVIGNL